MFANWNNEFYVIPTVYIITVNISTMCWLIFINWDKEIVA